MFHEGYGPYQPRCQYPFDSHGRHFCAQWYALFKWLEYSPSINKAFRFPCCVFSNTGHHQESFISNDFQNWKSALEKFHAHQSSIAHKSAILTWETGQQAQRNAERNVVNLINEQQKNS